MPSRRSFGLDANESALDDEDDAVQQPQVRRVFGRVSIGENQHRPSFTARWRSNPDVENGKVSTTANERPPIPSALKTSGEIPTTPLPLLPMVVLSIVGDRPYPHAHLRPDTLASGRLCSENFCLRMSRHLSYFSWSKVCPRTEAHLCYTDFGQGFGETHDEADVAFWTGVLGELIAIIFVCFHLQVS